MNPIIFLLAAVLVSSPSGAQSAGCPGDGGRTAVAVEAVAGDVLVLDDGTVLRLAGLEAPGRPLAVPDGAPWPIADESRLALAVLAVGNAVRLAWTGDGIDRHGRLPGRAVLDDGRWLEAEMVTAGLARVRWLPEEDTCFQALLALEAFARQAALGLWADPAYAVLSAGDPSLPSRNGLYELVEGRVVSVGRGSRMVFLNFGRNIRSDFTAMVVPDVAGRMADAGKPPDELVGRRIRVRGVVEVSGGPAIRINDPAEIELID